MYLSAIIIIINLFNIEINFKIKKSFKKTLAFTKITLIDVN